MLETTISLLAIVCSASVAAMAIYRWNKTSGFKSAVYLAAGVFAGLVALMNVTLLLAADASFVRTATLAYVGFAMAIVLPVARAIGNLTYETPGQTESEDAAV